jgi:sigma-E factor negative regulatory protein RseA
MTEQRDTLKESLSALMDGQADELEIRRLLDATEGERRSDLRNAWMRYHMVSRSIRGEGSATAIDCSSAIANALQTERAHAASPAKKVFEVLGQFTVAASVAMMTIWGVQEFNNPSLELGTQSAALERYDVDINTRPAMQFPAGFEPRIDAQTVSAGSIERRATTATPKRILPAIDQQAFPAHKIRTHIDRMLIKHSENSTLNSAHGSIPLVDVNKVDVTPERP